jgi:hypothetical protein
MIIGVLGFIGSGKGTVGDILSDLGFKKESFASHLKDVTAVMFNWDRNLLEGDTDESREFREKADPYWSSKFEKDFTPRLALQLMGTEVGRNVFDTNFWVNCIENKIVMNKATPNFVITDVRFKNEIEWITSKNGILIEVRRGITPHWYDIAVKANRGVSRAELWMQHTSGVHESEWRWIGHHTDETIYNDGTLEDLKKNVMECLTKYYGSSIIDDLNEGVLL